MHWTCFCYSARASAWLGTMPFALGLVEWGDKIVLTWHAKSVGDQLKLCKCIFTQVRSRQSVHLERVRKMRTVIFSRSIPESRLQEHTLKRYRITLRESFSSSALFLKTLLENASIIFGETQTGNYFWMETTQTTRYIMLSFNCSSSSVYSE